MTKNDGSVYVKITMRRKFSYHDLLIFYRILHAFDFADIREYDEERMAKEDFFNPIAVYYFKVKNPMNVIDAEHSMIHLLTGGFDWETSLEPDEKFKQWLGKNKKIKTHTDISIKYFTDKLICSSYPPENRAENMPLNEGGDLNDGKPED